MSTPDERSMQFMVHPVDCVSGAEIPVGNSGPTDGWGRLWQDGLSIDVASGSIHLDWDLDWEEGAPFTGHYALALSNGAVIERTLSGNHCGGGADVRIGRTPYGPELQEIGE